jgi:hypothetical protein
MGWRMIVFMSTMLPLARKEKTRVDSRGRKPRIDSFLALSTLLFGVGWTLFCTLLGRVAAACLVALAASSTQTIAATPGSGLLRLRGGMRCVVQRVKSASVTVDGAVISSIGRGICVLVGIHVEDAPEGAEWMAKKLTR